VSTFEGPCRRWAPATRHGRAHVCEECQAVQRIRHVLPPLRRFGQLNAPTTPCRKCPGPREISRSGPLPRFFAAAQRPGALCGAAPSGVDNPIPPAGHRDGKAQAVCASNVHWSTAGELAPPAGRSLRGAARPPTERFVASMDSTSSGHSEIDLRVSGGRPPESRPVTSRRARRGDEKKSEESRPGLGPCTVIVLSPRGNAQPVAGDGGRGRRSGRLNPPTGTPSARAWNDEHRVVV